jgi:hypothetical protein
MCHPCVDCGEPDIQVLDFDHVRGIKLSSIARMLSQRRPVASILDEMEKCEVRCANCHRRATARRTPNWRCTWLGR